MKLRWKGYKCCISRVFLIVHVYRGNAFLSISEYNRQHIKHKYQLSEIGTHALFVSIVNNIIICKNTIYEWSGIACIKLTTSSLVRNYGVTGLMKIKTTKMYEHVMVRATSSFKHCTFQTFLFILIPLIKTVLLHVSLCVHVVQLNRSGVTQWVVRLTRNVVIVGSSPIQDPRCFLEQETLL